MVLLLLVLLFSEKKDDNEGLELGEIEQRHDPRLPVEEHAASIPLPFTGFIQV